MVTVWVSMEGGNRLYRDWRLLEEDYEQNRDISSSVGMAALEACLDLEKPAVTCGPEARGIGEPWKLFWFKARSEEGRIGRAKVVEVDDGDVERVEGRSPIVSEPSEEEESAVG